MKKTIFKILAAVLSAAMLSGCEPGWKESDQVKDEILEDHDESESSQSSNEFPGKAVSLSDELEAAVCNALISQYGSDYSDADYVIPAFYILDFDDTAPDNIMIWGDFWRFAYKLEGETLVSVAGEDVSGCMHFNKQDDTYQGIGLDIPTVNGTEEKTGKDVFGSSYQSLLNLRDDYKKQEAVRAQMIADYVHAYGISATKYTDYSWEPSKLPAPSPDEDNIFLYLLKKTAAEEGPEEEIETAPVTETPAETEAPAVPETPEADSYIVKKGDTLGSIARRYGISTYELAEMNRDTILQSARRSGVKSGDLMKCANYIYPGETLAVPAGIE